MLVHRATASSAAKTRGLVVVQTIAADSRCFDIRSLRPYSLVCTDVVSLDHSSTQPAW